MAASHEFLPEFVAALASTSNGEEAGPFAVRRGTCFFRSLLSRGADSWSFAVDCNSFRTKLVYTAPAT
jgi:hypothetical protein